MWKTCPTKSALHVSRINIRVVDDSRMILHILRYYFHLSMEEVVITTGFSFITPTESSLQFNEFRARTSEDSYMTMISPLYGRPNSSFLSFMEKKMYVGIFSYV